MKKINDVKNWDIETCFIRFCEPNGSGLVGIDKATVVAASQGTPMELTLSEHDRMHRELLGTVWDCCVAIRERMLFPAAPYYKEIAAVSAQCKEHLGPELFEKFLRPNGRVGLPPA